MTRVQRDVIMDETEQYKKQKISPNLMDKQGGIIHDDQ